MGEFDSGDVGELRGSLKALIGEFREHVKDERERFKEFGEKLDGILAWRSEMSGAMKVGAMVWKVWAMVVSIALAWLGWIRGGPAK